MSKVSKSMSELTAAEYANVADELAALKVTNQNLLARHNALLKLNKLLYQCHDLSSFYQQIHQTIASLMFAQNFYIVMYDPTFATLEFVYHVDEKDSVPEGVIEYDQLAGSYTHHVISTAKPFLATSDTVLPLVTDGTINAQGNTAVDWLGVPLLSDGYVVGVMVVQSYSDQTRYSQQDLELLDFAGQQIVHALSRVQDQERLQQAVDARTKELMQQIRERERSELLQESLFHISQLTNNPDIAINDFYHQVHNIIGQLINTSNFYIARFNSESDTLNFVYYSDQNSENLMRDFEPRKMANGYTELVIRRAKTILLDRKQMMELYHSGETAKPSDETHSWLGVPLIHHGEVIGTIVIQSYRDDNEYNQQDADLLNFVSYHVCSAIKRRESVEDEKLAHELLERQVKIRTKALEEEIKNRRAIEDKLKHAASHDGLTGLANRGVFVDLLNHAIACRKRRENFQFAVLFLDLDRFKVVNDSLGHHAGDSLLKVVAKELSTIVREKDTVARLGGDEFVILIEDIESKQEAYEIAGRITELLERPFYIENQSIFIGTSIGVLFSDDRYDNADIMLRDADTAMYHAKDKGKGRYEVFDASMQKKIQNAFTLETDIREAIEASEFIPYFQPIVNLNNDKVVGFEALARWQSHKRGLVFPDEFIPLAEETNLVMAIDLQIIEKSCQQLKKWQQEYDNHNLYVSANLFCNHFFNATLVEDIRHILDRVGLAPEHLRVELTERALLENSETVLANMQGLKQLGVKILLDDFGTGYSSLSYLHRFPIDVLKIDRSFINNVHEHDNHRAIIKTIIDLATSLQMATVGEGIENLEDADLLKRMECNFGQGYYFAKPMPAENFDSHYFS
ncbi:EAL domain-containing protein [Endozoicomonas sp. G2_1]|uniref:sensor domain-containing phosphodiesterase n=1 Tax=Endozoicomonas sp. G2_1 TaxID=2821091 RepID=UPI001ADA2FB4|nr:EAL domain-containing protein [Endozoicomonas sp. G2_1]MBO9491134.1 EAL domain-containing protein [Endozoicomonas sp. G2_1]